MARVGTVYYRRREDGRCAVEDCTRTVAPVGARCQHHRARGYEKPAPTPPGRREAPHGDLLRYQRDGCRCVRCRSANATATAAYRAKRKAAA